MKTSWVLGFTLCATLGLSAQTALQQESLTQSIDSPFSVVSRDANSRIWERTTYESGDNGEVLPHVHRYTELATGMHYKDPQTGEWAESKEEIEIMSTGGAQAVYGQYKVYFPADIYDGLIELVTPDGKHLKSRPLGIAYGDGENSVLIAELKHSTGQLLPSGNQVIYTNAFTDFAADLVLTYRKGGFESDLVFREQPLLPEAFRLSPKNTCMELLTEFFDSPEPEKVLTDTADLSGTNAANATAAVQDTTLVFGAMSMVQGKAFSVGTANDDEIGNGTARGPRRPSKTKWDWQLVSKSWWKIQGRTFLIESVSFEKLGSQLKALPASKTQAAISSAGSVLHQVSTSLLLPPLRIAKQNTGKIQLAKADLYHGRSVVLDYVTVSSALTNFTFQGDSTYFVTGPVNLYGTTVIEGGTAVKFSQATACYLNFVSNIVCQTAPYRPAVFTSKDDNSVGETVSGSTGSPVVDSQNYYFDIQNGLPGDLHDLRISYAYCGIANFQPPGITLRDIQFVHTAWPVWVVTSTANSAYGRLRNILMIDVTGSAIESTYIDADIQNLTVNGCTQLGYNDFSAHMNLTNCLLVGVQSMGDIPYNTNCVAIPNTNEVVFQTVGGGTCYLVTNSPYRNVGTTNINPSLLAELGKKTTYPPISYTNITFTSVMAFGPQAQRDTDVPDLGYHYDPLDYAFGGCHANSNMTFSAGTAVGWFRVSSGWYHAGQGIHIGNRQVLTFTGTEENPDYWVRLNTVQERDVTAGYGPGGITSWADQNGSYSEAAEVHGNFLRTSGIAHWDNSFRDDSGFLIGRFSNCEFYNCGNGWYVSSYFFTNCLFCRSDVGVAEGSSGNEMHFRNCTILGRYFTITPTAAIAISVKDCAFIGPQISIGNLGANSAYATYDYNAFTNASNPLVIGGTHDQRSVSFSWQTGPLGNFYLSTNSVLVNTGHTNANLVGLYHYTTTTNEVKEGNSTVDIGYHYVAVDTSGNPIDSNGDGIPDYLEDANGNGLWDVDTESNDWKATGPDTLGTVGFQVYTPLK